MRAPSGLILDDRIAEKSWSVEDLVTTRDLIKKVRALKPRLADIVECRFYLGLTDEETASALRNFEKRPWNGTGSQRAHAPSLAHDGTGCCSLGSRSAAMDEQTSPHQIRCAVYTGKSTEEGLEQAFNSLVAQRESAVAYSRARSMSAGR